MKVSVVIPAKNEELYLPRLLKSLKQQSFRDFEVIVADANSSDSTREIARSFGARVVPGGLPGPGRNRGASIARGDILLFLDADVVLPSDFLLKNVSRFVKRNLDVATTFLKPLSRRVRDLLIHFGWNCAYVALSKTRPACCGFHIFVRRDVFVSSGGFDESVVYGEDAEFVMRLHSCGARFGILSKPVFVSVRRLDKEGRINFLVKNLFACLHVIFRGHIRKEIFVYDWGHDSHSIKNECVRIARIK